MNKKTSRCTGNYFVCFSLPLNGCGSTIGFYEEQSSTVLDTSYQVPRIILLWKE